MTAYYNENDKFAANWLRELIKDGLIAYGEVDERSILDVQPSDLNGYQQCHFFAGIGGWSYALRLASWPDSRKVWTGSCPCQPFSSAGKQRGIEDERHLWPHWFRLIRQCQPNTIFGEQVERAIGHGWLDAVQDDLERENYALGSVVFPACSVQAPHLRQRLYFVAQRNRHESAGQPRETSPQGQEVRLRDSADAADGRGDVQLAHTECGRRQQCDEGIGSVPEPNTGGQLVQPQQSGLEGQPQSGHDGPEPERLTSEPNGPTTSTGPWSDVRWIDCADGHKRPIPLEPAFFPLVDGISAGRVGLLRGCGNAIVPPQASEFIKAYMKGLNASS